MKSCLTNISRLLVFLCLFLLSNSSTDEMVYSPIYAQSSTSNQVCAPVGNHLAQTFPVSLSSDKAQEIYEGPYMLAIINGQEDVAGAVTAINNFQGTVIIRVGASTNSLGPEASDFARMINEVASQTGDKNFIVTATHNEPNGQEAPAICRRALSALGDSAVNTICGASAQNVSAWNQMISEVLTYEMNFARTVINQTDSQYKPRIKFITGQIDTYFNSSAEIDNSNAQEFIEGLTTIPEIEGVAIPLYTTINFQGDDGGAKERYDKFARLIRDRGREIHITESGPFEDANYTSTFEEYLRAVQAVLTSTIPPNSLLLFNSHGINPDPNFRYTQPFWNRHCRQALRDRCMDTEHVLAMCGELIDEGEHLCTSWCRGYPHDPCYYTRGNDCSYPVDMIKFISPNITEEEKQLATDYLTEYLGDVVTSKGLQFQTRGSVNGYDICLPNDSGEMSQVAQALCVDHDGGGEVFVDVNSIRTNTLNPPEEKTADSIRNDHAAGAYTNPLARKLIEAGPLDRMMNRFERIVRIGRMVELKEQCYQRTLEYGNRPIAESMEIRGLRHSVRCMNYQDWREDLGLGDDLGLERNLFQNNGRLNECGRIYQENESVRQVNACMSQLMDVREDLPELYDKIVTYSTVHVATYPIFGGVDLYPPDNEDWFYQFYDPFGDHIGFAEESNRAILLSDSNFIDFRGEEEAEIFLNMPGLLGTRYYVRAETTALDVFEASNYVRDKLTPRQVEVTPSLFQLTLSDILNRVSNFIGNLLGNFVETFNNLNSFFNEPGPYFFHRIDPAFRNPDDVNDNDPRIYALQFAFYKASEECLSFSDDIVTDLSLNDRTFPNQGTDGSATFRTEGVGANLFNLVRRLVSESLPDTVGNFRTINFVLCELSPKKLADADENAIAIADLGISRGAQTQRLSKLLGGESLNFGGGISTNPSINDSNLALNPPGCGDNVNIVNPNVDVTDEIKDMIDCPAPPELWSWFKGPLLQDYCDYQGIPGEGPCYCGNGGRYGECPPLPEVRQILERIGNNESVSRHGGGSQVVLNQERNERLWSRQSQARHFSSMEVGFEENLYFCNRNNDPDCRLGILRPNQESNLVDATCGTQFLFSDVCAGKTPCYEYIIDQAISRNTCHGTVINPYIAIGIALNENGGLVSKNPDGSAADHFGCNRFVHGTIEEKVDCMLNTLTGRCTEGGVTSMKKYGYCCYYNDGVCDAQYNRLNACEANKCTALDDDVCFQNDYMIAPLSVLMSRTNNGSTDVYISRQQAQSYANSLKQYLSMANTAKYWEEEYYRGFIDSFKRNNCEMFVE